MPELNEFQDRLSLSRPVSPFACAETVLDFSPARATASLRGFLPLANRPIALACAEDPPVVERILNHLASKDLPGL